MKCGHEVRTYEEVDPLVAEQSKQRKEAVKAARKAASVAPVEGVKEEEKKVEVEEKKGTGHAAHIRLEKGASKHRLLGKV